MPILTAIPRESMHAIVTHESPPRMYNVRTHFYIIHRSSHSKTTGEMKSLFQALFALVVAMLILIDHQAFAGPGGKCNILHNFFSFAL